MFNEIKQKAAEFASENATMLLTAGGVVGTVATAVLAARAAFSSVDALKAEQIVKQSEKYTVEDLADASFDELADLPELDKLTMLKVAGPYFIPPVLTGAATITAIIMSNRMSAQKAAALAAAYGLAERNLSDYKAKIEEKLTGPKKTAIDDELAQEQVDRTPGHEKLVIIDGEVLCLDRSGGRYFRCSMEELRRAINTTNHEINNHGYATASFFYKEVGLPGTDWSDSVGFDMGNLVDLTFSTAMTADQRPCITFEFKTLPKAEYGPKDY